MPEQMNTCPCGLPGTVMLKAGEGLHWAICKNCGRRTPVAITRSEAVRKWNQGLIVLPKREIQDG